MGLYKIELFWSQIHVNDKGRTVSKGNMFMFNDDTTIASPGASVYKF